MFITMKSTAQKSIDAFLQKYSDDFAEIKYNKNEYIYKVIIMNKNKITFYKNLTITIEGDRIDEKIQLLLIKEFMDKNLYIGSDEVGNGEAIGPIVVCGVAFENLKQKQKFFLKGMIDSKKINFEKIMILGKQIKEEVPHKCIIVDVKSFNENYSRKNINIKLLNAVFHNRIHQELGQNMSNRTSVIDEFVNLKKYKEYLKETKDEKFYETKYIFEPRGENKYLEIAAASILSKYIFNRYIIDALNKSNIDYKRYLKNSINYNSIANDINKKIINVSDDLIKIWKK